MDEAHLSLGIPALALMARGEEIRVPMEDYSLELVLSLDDEFLKEFASQFTAAWLAELPTVGGKQ
jgi:hypothetical protein